MKTGHNLLPQPEHDGLLGGLFCFEPHHLGRPLAKVIDLAVRQILKQHPELEFVRAVEHRTIRSVMDMEDGQGPQTVVVDNCRRNKALLLFRTKP